MSSVARSFLAKPRTGITGRVQEWLTGMLALLAIGCLAAFGEVIRRWAASGRHDLEDWTVLLGVTPFVLAVVGLMVCASRRHRAVHLAIAFASAGVWWHVGTRVSSSDPDARAGFALLFALAAGSQFLDREQSLSTSTRQPQRRTPGLDSLCRLIYAALLMLGFVLFAAELFRGPHGYVPMRHLAHGLIGLLAMHGGLLAVRETTSRRIAAVLSGGVIALTACEGRMSSGMWCLLAFGVLCVVAEPLRRARRAALDAEFGSRATPPKSAGAAAEP